MIIVDDNSPDGTQKEVEVMQEKFGDKIVFVMFKIDIENKNWEVRVRNCLYLWIRVLLR